MNNDKAFELFFEEDNLGVYSISLVNNPAIDVLALQFSSQVVEDKRVLVSPILIPNQKVYRNDINGGGGFVFVTEETIEKLQQNFFKRNFHKNSSFEHKDKIADGVYVFESWIINDPKNDKSNSLGFKDLPKGTWMVSLKIEDKDIWNDYIKTGKVKGLSIDAFLKTKEKINFNKQINMKNSLTTLFKRAVAKKVAFNADLTEVKINDDLSYFVDKLEVGGVVYNTEGEIVKNFQFDFEGFTYFVGEDGVIADKEPINVNVEMEFNDEEIEAILEEIKEEIVVDYEAQVAELNAKIAELEAKLAVYEAVEEEQIELKKSTAAKPISAKFSKVKQVNPKDGVLGVMRQLKK